MDTYMCSAKIIGIYYVFNTFFFIYILDTSKNYQCKNKNTKNKIIKINKSYPFSIIVRLIHHQLIHTTYIAAYADFGIVRKRLE